MKRTTFAWGLVGALLLPALSLAEEAGVVVLDRVGPTVRAQNDEKPEPPPAPASKAPKPVPDTLPVPHDHGTSMHGMPAYGMPVTGYGDYGMVGGYGCCSDEGLKPTGNPILDAPFELTTALFKGMFCKCGRRCSSGWGQQPGAADGGCNRYRMTYPVRPWYFDQRDGQVYSAQGYGVPMAVPVAPCVRHTYNYSWGIPSSRITPLSRMPGPGGY